MQQSKPKRVHSRSITQLSEYLSHRCFQPSINHPKNDDIEALTWKGDQIPWNGLSCLSVVCYVLTFCSDSHHNDILHILSRLNDQASEYEAVAVSEEPKLSFRNDYALMSIDDLYSASQPLMHMHQKNYSSPMHRRKGKEIAETFVNDLMPKLEEFFNVPKREEHLASFIHFLLQILNSETNTETITESDLALLLKESLLSLRTGLTFLLAVLGDVPFQFMELDEVRCLLSKFRAVANGAGSLIYSCVFSIRALGEQQFHESNNVLLNKFKLLNENIKEHCINFSELLLPVSTNSRYTVADDSLFIVDSLLKDIVNFICHLGLTGDMKNLLRTLHRDLIYVQILLKDVSIPQELKTRELKECVIQFRNIAYEAEYLLNSFVVGNLPDWYLSIRIPNVSQKLVFSIKKFQKAKEICDRKVLDMSEDHSVQVMQPTPKVVDDHYIVGFQIEMIEILNELARGSKELRIISIHGMSGIGKTTLAKKLYSYPLITDYFDERVWCIVSQTYKRRKVLIDVLMSLRSMLDDDEIMEMGDAKLTENIYKSLKGRRYLIVMDDVWDSGAWDALRRYLPNDKNGSRILVTTRIQDIVPGNSIIYPLPFLSEDQCWELLEKKVFLDEPCPLELQGPGRQIASKCNGLPLAVVVVAGVLVKLSKEKSVWAKVEESLETYTSDIMRIFELSYEHLPNHLKLCFLYLGVFWENVEIPVGKLIWLWIAEGFIGNDEEKTPHDVAEEYLMNLIDRSLVLVSKFKSTGGVKACKIHDLLLEMCLRRAQKDNFLYLIKDNYSSTFEKHFRLCARSTTPSHLRPFSLYCRSFFGHLSDPSSCLPQMKHLRVMKLFSMWSANISPNLNRIDLLVHLRYLVVDQMPEPIIGKLVNLEVLCVDNLSRTIYIPSVLMKMEKLRHLHVRPQARFKKDCDSSQPNNLQSLSFIYIHSAKDYEILTCSPNLCKLKCLCPPEIPDFRFLTKLKSLKIEINDILQVPKNNTPINFPLNILKLSLFGTCLPWEGMSILGRLPMLQALKLLWNAFEGKKWKTNEDEFYKLRFLKLDGLNLKQWISLSDHFPRLEHLLLHNCDKLTKIPTELGDFPNLLTIQVTNCSHKVSLSISQLEQEQRDSGNQQLKVIITDQRWSKEQLMSKYKGRGS